MFSAIFLACGRSNGEIWILDPILLTPKQEVITVSNYSIEKIAFSFDNDQLAFCVSFYFFNHVFASTFDSEFTYSLTAYLQYTGCSRKPLTTLGHKFSR